MNYEKLYFAFIEKWKRQEIEEGVYTEKHHILPRYAGGNDSADNLVRLTYRQHTMAHKLLWKAYGNWQDYTAYRMMEKQDPYDKKEVLQAIGRMNVESGHLDRIRPSANNEKQRDWARKWGRELAENGFLEKIRAKKVKFHLTEEQKARRSALYKELYSSPEMRERLDSQRKIANEVNRQKSRELARKVLENAERNDEYLHKHSSRSKNLFVSPEGLEFESPVYAAKYYGDIPHYTIENWCKRGMRGWYRKPKAPQE